MSGPAASFRPLRPASRTQRALILLLGPVLWLVALLVLPIVLDRRDAVEYALVVLAVSFAGAVFVLGLGRIRRGRAERAG